MLLNSVSSVSAVPVMPPSLGKARKNAWYVTEAMVIVSF